MSDQFLPPEPSDDNPPQRRAGRVPPHNIAAEESVLGAMLLTKEAIADAIEILSSDDFYKPAHQKIFNAITALFAAGEPADIVTVADELGRAGMLDGMGGNATLIDLQANTPAATNTVEYARIVYSHAQLRRLIQAGSEISEIGFSQPDDVVKAVDEAESLVFNLAQGRDSSNYAALEELLDETLNLLEERVERGSTVTGTPTGFSELDRLLAGLQPNNLIVVGARPAMGKTSFGLNIAAHAAMEADAPVLFFSLEMSQYEISQRILCTEARVDSSKVRIGSMNDDDWTKISHAVGRLSGAPLWIDDNPNTTVMEIRAKARRLKSRVGKIGMVVVDYLQLMSGRVRAENRQVEVSEISRSLKILARELECPVVALSQLSRNLEQRQDKRPMLSDLRESGSIEQDADVVMFLYRDEVYNMESPDQGMAEVLVAKHRSGPTGRVKLAWLKHYTRFADMARASDTPPPEEY
ncbi:MAG: replicative DNA helicase [Acidimicrobiales bacterium]|jgi:replicative DNA helicase|nr:replicative DNA helicase [Acidimicrobiales bacterium]MDP6322721.1 replicative DNA helicase [Acidimicrobiales bacterium]HJM28714.1 replicative DNA helicase [Acidimicrobiales bacterium]HJM97327.1 replicative DNA helicase [Acidimicrobiales bacterium]